MVANERKIFNRPSFRAIEAVVMLALAYGFASLAIDSARTLEYLAAIVFLVWGISSAVKAVRLSIRR